MLSANNEKKTGRSVSLPGVISGVFFICLLSIPFAGSLFAADTYTATADGQWVQLNAEELDAVAEGLAGGIEAGFPQYYGGDTTGENPVWGMTTQSEPRERFFFPGGGTETDDLVEIGDHNIILDLKYLQNSLDYSEIPLTLPTEFNIGQLSIGESGSLTVNETQLNIATATTNAGTFNIANAGIHFGSANGYTGSGVIILNGNATLGGKMIFNNIFVPPAEEESEEEAVEPTSETIASGARPFYNGVKIFNGGNVVDLQDTMVGTTGGEGVFQVFGQNGGASATLSGTLTFAENTTSREMVFQDVYTLIHSDVLTNVELATVKSGATIAPVESEFNAANTSFLFENGSSWRSKTASGASTFTADHATFENGSTVYVNVGSANYDKIIANGINFAEGENDEVKVILLNLGNHDQNVAADDVFSISENGTDIRVGGGSLSEITSDAVDAEANTAELVGANGGKITFQSAKNDDSLDVIRINSLLYDAGESKSLGFDVTGVKTANVNPNPTPTDPWGNSESFRSTNTLVIGNTIVDEMYGTGLYNTIAYYAGADQGKLLHIISALDPVVVSSGNILAQNNVAQVHRSIDDRTQIFHAANAGSGRYASNSQTTSIYRAQNGRYGSRKSPARCGEAWFEGIGGYMNQDDRNGVAGYDGEVFGFGVGIDRLYGNHFMFGGAFGGTYSNITANQNYGTGKTSNYLATLYGGYCTGPLVLSFSGGYGYGNIESHRTVAPIGYADGERDTDTWYGSLEIAYRLDSQSFYLTPFYRMDYVGYREDGFTESGQNINMIIDARKDDAYLQTLGLRLGTQFSNGCDWVISPEFSGGWIHDYGSGTIVTTGQFVQGGSPFILDGVARLKNKAYVGFGINTAITPRLSIYAKYDGILASSYYSHIGQVGLCLYF